LARENRWVPGRGHSIKLGFLNQSPGKHVRSLGGGQNIDKVLLKSLNIKIKNLMLNGSAAWLIYEF